MILIDTGHMGRMLHHARIRAWLPRAQTAKMLNISEEQLIKYEKGADLIPADIWERILAKGLRKMCSQYLMQCNIVNNQRGTL